MSRRVDEYQRCNARGYTLGMTTQIAVKLPEETLAAIDRLVHNGDFESRSSAVRAGLQRVIDERARGAIDDAFAAGFALVP